MMKINKNFRVKFVLFLVFLLGFIAGAAMLYIVQDIKASYVAYKQQNQKEFADMVKTIKANPITIDVEDTLVVQKYETGGRYVITFAFDDGLISKASSYLPKTLWDATEDWKDDHPNKVGKFITSSSSAIVYEAL